MHEANVVVGRANRLIIRFGAMLATGFEKPKGGDKAREVIHVGNPVRKAIAAAATPYAPPLAGEPFHLLVFGGSQGARVFSGLVPARPGRTVRRRRSGGIRVVQQARPEDLGVTRAAFGKLGVEAAVEPFFTDMGERLAARASGNLPGRRLDRSPSLR